MGLLNFVYATDEDIALRASADFAILCPRDQKLACGADGAILPSDRWTLRSASVDFQANGVLPGQVMQLLGPSAAFRPPGEFLVVSSVAPNAATLRRKGLAITVGQPASQPTGLVGIEFVIATLGPQIERASYDLNRLYGIDDLVAGRRSSDLYDPREVTEATVLTVLYRQYLDMSRDPGGKADGLAVKAEAIKDELDNLLARVVVHWQPKLPGVIAEKSTSRFSSRLTR